MNIYIDNDYKCHIVKTENSYRSFDVPFFDRKCDAFIEGYCYIPDGEMLIKPDGTTYVGEMLFPWKPWEDLSTSQLEYELGLITEYSNAFSEIANLINSQNIEYTMVDMVSVRKNAILSRFNDMLEELMTM